MILPSRCLSIFSGDDIRPLDIATLKPSSCLQKLHIAGKLQTLPDWFSQLHNLTKLRLSFSKLEEDPLSVLAQLPNLLFLQRECLRRVSWLQNRRPWEGCVARAHGLRGPRGHADSSNTNRRVTEHAEPNPAAECARAAGAAVVACGSEECGEKKEAGQEGALSGGARRRRHR